MNKTRLLVFGGCNLRRPLVANLRVKSGANHVGEWGDISPDYRITGLSFVTFTINEMIQAVNFYNGELEIPRELWKYCTISSKYPPTPEKNPIDKSDVALIEPNTSLCIEFDGYFLNRRPIMKMVYGLMKIDSATHKLSWNWIDQGISGLNEQKKLEFAEELVPLIPKDMPERDLITSILLRAKGRKSNTKEELARLVQMIPCPAGVVAYTWAYMPDGRAISWPAEFHRETLEAASALGLPVLEPWRVVQQVGVDFALKGDRRHYTEAFMPVIAKPIIEFAFSIAAGA